jgi:hypothetical protein
VPLALLTGTRTHLGPAAATMARAGFDVRTWAVGASPADGPFDCYVQLPCALPERVTTAELRSSTGRRSTDDLICRIDALAAVAARLRPNASVLLALDDPNASTARPDILAPDLLAAVALALLEDLGRPAARLAVIPLAQLFRPAPTPTRFDSLVVGAAAPWEMPTPPLVSAP